jgi:hypothetical protein
MAKTKGNEAISTQMIGADLQIHPSRGHGGVILAKTSDYHQKLLLLICLP